LERSSGRAVPVARHLASSAMSPTPPTHGNPFAGEDTHAASMRSSVYRRCSAQRPAQHNRPYAPPLAECHGPPTLNPPTCRGPFASRELTCAWARPRRGGRIEPPGGRSPSQRSTRTPTARLNEGKEIVSWDSTGGEPPPPCLAESERRARGLPAPGLERLACPSARDGGSSARSPAFRRGGARTCLDAGHDLNYPPGYVRALGTPRARAPSRSRSRRSRRPGAQAAVIEGARRGFARRARTGRGRAPGSSR